MKIYICGYSRCKTNGLMVTVLRPRYKNESADSDYVFDRFWTEDLDIVRNAADIGSPLDASVSYRNGFGFLTVIAPVIGPPDAIKLSPDQIPAVFRV